MAIDTRTRLVQTTLRLLQAHGYHGTGLNLILSESGAPRGSLYFHFPGGKEQLALEAVRYGIAWATRDLEASLKSAPDPVDGVCAYIDAAARLMRDSNFAFGCPVAPVILDSPESESPLWEACRSAFEQWHGVLAEGLREAGATAERAKTLATLIIASLEGALLMSRSQRDTRALDTISSELLQIVRGALPAKPKRAAGKAKPR